MKCKKCGMELPISFCYRKGRSIIIELVDKNDHIGKVEPYCYKCISEIINNERY